MKKFLEILGFLVFSVVAAVGGFIVYCVLTDREDMIYDLKERCGFFGHSCCCHDGDEEDYFDDEFYEEDDLEEYFEDEDEYDEDDDEPSILDDANEEDFAE